MALFEQQTSRSGDAATRALSATTVGTDFVEKVYQNIAQIYDYTYGPTLHPGRLEAIKKMRIRPGTEVLEVGVGTGINLSLYPTTCAVTGIDFSSSMLEKARERVARGGLRQMRLLQMDAADLKFADDSFDIVYAPYLISVVPDPVAVAREMSRVCKPGGRIVILNHFKSTNSVFSMVEKAISPLTVHIGFKSDLDLPRFLSQAELRPLSIQKVTLPSWSLVTCVKE